jgi:hypothetical protein
MGHPPCGGAPPQKTAESWVTAADTVQAAKNHYIYLPELRQDQLLSRYADALAPKLSTSKAGG